MDGHVETHKWSKETEKYFREIDELGLGAPNSYDRVPVVGSAEEQDLQWFQMHWPGKYDL